MKVESSYGPILVEVAGPDVAPAVVFTPGITMSLEAFAPQAEALSAQYRTVRWDLPGHGGSFSLEERPFTFSLAAEALIAVLDELGIETAVLVGVSLGSLIHQYVAAHHPDRVAALVDVGGLPLHEPMSAVAAFGGRVGVALSSLLPARSYYRLFATARAVKEPTRQYLEAGIAEFGKRKVGKLTLEFLADMAAGIAAPPERPLLIINGEKEMPFVKKRSRRWHEGIEGSRRVEISDAGHIANLDNPQEFNRVLLAFLQGLFAPEQEVAGLKG